MNSEVCAAIVTYHPNEQLELLIERLRPQVGRLVLIDNHSFEAEVSRLQSLAAEQDFSLVENIDNLGLGTALNQAIGWAKKHRECEFVLFFDQDSLISEDFVAAMVTEYRKQAENMRVSVVMPKIVHRRTGLEYLHHAVRGRHLVAQTSGSLMPLQVFAEVGLYREDLFIDLVDYEFCLRVATHGWRILYCQTAILYHEPGNVGQNTVLGFLRVTTTNYSPLRKYYSMRNGIWTIMKYGLLFPAWAAKHALAMLKDVVRALVFERDRGATILMWARALLDAFRFRLGKYPNAKRS